MKTARTTHTHTPKPTLWDVKGAEGSWVTFEPKAEVARYGKVEHRTF